MIKKFSVLSIVAIACLSWNGIAQAEVLYNSTNTDNNTVFHGFKISGSTSHQIAGVNGVGGIFKSSSDVTSSFKNDFCIMLYKDIFTGTRYDYTVSLKGIVGGITLNPTVAGQISYLLGVRAQSPEVQASSLLQAGLQSAIWHLAGIGGAFNLQAQGNGGTSGAMYQEYLKDIQNTETRPISDVLWITTFITNPLNGAKILAQAQIALNPCPPNNPTVPEPSALALLGLGGIGVTIGAYRRRRLAGI